MTTRIALIADIHGNLVALDAVLADIAKHGVNHIVCLGDLAMSGPRPREVIARVRALECPVVKGNCDDLVVAMRAAGRPHDAAIAHWAIEIDYWSATQLSLSDLAYLRALPPAVNVSLGDGATLLCVHGSPSSYTDRILPDTPDERLDALLLPLPPGVRVIAGGHTHIPLARRYRGVTIVNPGSVGLPLDCPLRGKDLAHMKIGAGMSAPIPSGGASAAATIEQVRREHMAKTFGQMVGEARQEVTAISPQEA